MLTLGLAALSEAKNQRHWMKARKWLSAYIIPAVELPILSMESDENVTPEPLQHYRLVTGPLPDKSNEYFK